jgi:hypothetical protein
MRQVLWFVVMLAVVTCSAQPGTAKARTGTSARGLIIRADGSLLSSPVVPTDPALVVEIRSDDPTVAIAKGVVAFIVPESMDVRYGALKVEVKPRGGDGTWQTWDYRQSFIDKAVGTLISFGTEQLAKGALVATGGGAAAVTLGSLALKLLEATAGEGDLSERGTYRGFNLNDYDVVLIPWDIPRLGFTHGFDGVRVSMPVHTDNESDVWRAMATTSYHCLLLDDNNMTANRCDLARDIERFEIGLAERPQAPAIRRAAPPTTPGRIVYESWTAAWGSHVAATAIDPIPGNTSPHKLADDAWGAQLSSDGSKLAFFVSPANRLTVMDVASGQKHVLNQAPASTLYSWSPDGTRFVVLVNSGGRDDAWVVDADNGTRLAVFPDCRWARFSPDSSRLVLSGLRGETTALYVASADGSDDRPRKIVDTGALQVTAVDWGVDGRIVLRTADGRGDGIAVVNEDGSGFREVISSTALRSAVQALGISVGDQSIPRGPFLSPDCRTLAFTYQLGDKSDIFLIPVNGGPLQLLVDGRPGQGAHISCWVPGTEPGL